MAYNATVRIKPALQMPKSVINRLPKTCKVTMTPAPPRRPAINAATTSDENVEKVVSPPRNPVTVNKRHCGDSCGWLEKKATATPIR